MPTSINPKDPISYLPNELYFEISHFLNLSDLNAFARTNIALHKILNPTLYKRDVNSHDPISLFWASEKNSPSTAEKSLSAGFAITSKRDFAFNLPVTSGKYTLHLRGVTPLLLSSYFNSLAVVKVLLLNNADPNTQEQNSGRPAISWALRKGYMDIVQVLMDDPRTDVNSKSRWGQTLRSNLLRYRTSELELLNHSVCANPRSQSNRVELPLRMPREEEDSSSETTSGYMRVRC